MKEEVELEGGIEENHILHIRGHESLRHSYSYPDHHHCRGHHGRCGRVGVWVVWGSVGVALVAMICLILFFSVIKARDPHISVDAVQVPNIGKTDPPESTVNMSIAMYMRLKNPNKATFTFRNNQLKMDYNGDEVASMYIPPGSVSPSRDHSMVVTLTLQPFTAHLTPDYDPSSSSSSANLILLHSSIVLSGTVRPLNLFTFHVRASSFCDITVSANDGSVPRFRCSS